MEVGHVGSHLCLDHLSSHLCNRAGEVSLTDRAISYNNQFIEELGVILQDNIQVVYTWSDLSLHGLKTDIGEDQRDLVTSNLQFILSIHIGDGTRGGSLLNHGNPDQGGAICISNYPFYGSSGAVLSVQPDDPHSEGDYQAC